VNTFEVIAARRSIKRLVEPAPGNKELRQMFVAASYAPDHHDLKPWQFIVIRGAKKAEMGQVMVDGLLARTPDATEGQIEKERFKPDRAPCIIAVIARRMPSTLPFSELYAATCAATQNLLLAATELGFGTIWRSGAAISDERMRDWLEVQYGDEIVGFVYTGTITESPPPHEEVDLGDSVIW
jgi:nitroreductase